MANECMDTIVFTLHQMIRRKGIVQMSLLLMQKNDRNIVPVFVSIFFTDEFSLIKYVIICLST